LKYTPEATPKMSAAAEAEAYKPGTAETNVSALTATSYVAGTIFRIYKEDGVTHYTAVLLKNGNVLEVKNPETGEKAKFNSLVEWREARGAAENDVRVDTERTAKPVATAEDGSLKMKYPKNNKKINRQFRWYYDMMKECNPAMLDNEEIIKAYNALVDVCHKYYNEICPSYHFSHKCYKYSKNLLSYSTYSEWNKLCGFPVDYSSELNDEACKEILDCYKPFYDLVHKDLHAFMEKKEKERKTLSQIKTYRAKIAHIERVISRMTRRYSENLNYYKNKVKGLEDSLKE
jgi:hypothetical protein